MADRIGVPTIVSGEAAYLSKEKLDTEYTTKDINGSPDADAVDKFAMLSDKVIAWANHKSKDENEEINYFYLNKDGSALTTWKEIDDDIYICGNDKGELYHDEVAKVAGKYYYFNADGICNYKYLNNIADYAVVVGTDGYEADKTLGDRAIKFYETNRNRGEQGVIYRKLADIKDDLEDLQVESVNFGSRKVKVRSLTESEALLAWAMAEVICEDEKVDIKEYVKNETALPNQGSKDIKCSIYKLRTSSSIEKKSVTFNLK